MYSVLLLVAISIIGCQCAEQPFLSIVKANDKFTANAYKQISTSSSENIVFSGLSANIILSLLAEGAKGDTQNELLTSLSLVHDERLRRAAFTHISATLNTDTDDLKLLSANKIYPAKNFQVDESFKNIAITNYRADVENVNFNDRESAANIINKWVEDKTKYRITNLLEPSSINPLTKMVLVNTLYFSGKWAEEFKSVFTSKQQFFLTDSNTKDLEFMQSDVNGKWRHCGYHKVQFLELPFVGEKVSMTFILPDNVTSLSVLEEKFAELMEPSEKLKEGKILVTMPKFRIETKTDLLPILQKMGVNKIFTEEADLSGISKKGGLKVDYVVQKAFIDVNEGGVEAAAATRVVIVSLADMEPIATFNANHPFLWYLREHSTGAVLFAGRFQG